MLAVILVSVLLAFILAPVMDLLIRLPLPRGLAAAVVVLLLLTLVAGLVYYSSNQAITFLQDLSKYTQQGIREEISQRFRQQVKRWGSLDPGRPAQSAGTVRAGTNWTEILTRGFGSVSADSAGRFLRALPGLLHADLATSRALGYGHAVLPGEPAHCVRHPGSDFRHDSYLHGRKPVDWPIYGRGKYGHMLAILHFPFFYFVGFISGFLSLIPYLGVVLAMVPLLFRQHRHISTLRTWF